MKTENLYRLQLKIDFVKNNKGLFDAYSKIKGYPNGKEPIVKKIAELAREKLGYSEKTYSYDIARSLYLLYNAIKQNIKI